MNDEDLKCVSCNRIFQAKPITLSPCGWVICSSHFVLPSIKCPICPDKHMVYLENSITTKTLEIKYFKYKLDKLIKELDLTLSQTNAAKNDPENHINDFYSKIINRIDLQREQVKLLVDNHFDIMLKQVQNAQKECVKNKRLNEQLKKYDENEYREKLKPIEERLKEKTVNKNSYNHLVDDIKNVEVIKKSLTETIDSLTGNKNYVLTPVAQINCSNLFGKLEIAEASNEKEVVASGTNLFKPIPQFNFTIKADFSGFNASQAKSITVEKPKKVGNS